MTGMGTTVEKVRGYLRDDLKMLDLFDQAVLRPRPHGGEREKGKVANGHLGGSSKLGGNGRERALRKLRKDRPDLHAKVTKKEMTANAAMLEAGFRKKKTPLEQLRHWWARASAKERR